MNIIYFIPFFIFSIEKFFDSFLKKKKLEGEVKYKNFTRFLISTYTIGMFIPFIEFIVFNKEVKTIYILIGLFFLIPGVFLRKFSVKALGENWSIYNKEIPGQRLIKKGPYKYMRHPYYLAAILELLGLKFYFNSSLAFLIIIFIQAPLLCVRVFLEEKLLEEQFGRDFLDYKKQTIIL